MVWIYACRTNLVPGCRRTKWRHDYKREQKVAHKTPRYNGKHNAFQTILEKWFANERVSPGAHCLHPATRQKNGRCVCMCANQPSASIGQNACFSRRSANKLNMQIFFCVRLFVLFSYFFSGSCSERHFQSLLRFSVLFVFRVRAIWYVNFMCSLLCSYVFALSLLFFFTFVDASRGTGTRCILHLSMNNADTLNALRCTMVPE